MPIYDDSAMGESCPLHMIGQSYNQVVFDLTFMYFRDLSIGEWYSIYGVSRSTHPFYVDMGETLTWGETFRDR